MTGEDSSQRAPRQLDTALSRPASDPELELPSSLEPWVAALGLWPHVDESTYRLVARCFGGGRGPEWSFLAPLLLHAGLVEPGTAPGTFTFRSEWLLALERALVTLGGADAARAALVGAWLDTPDRQLFGEVAGWASKLARWDAVDAIWMALCEQTGDLPPEALAVYRDLPLAARKARPMLSWAAADAESLLGESPHLGKQAMLQLLLRDSAHLHADWAVREDTDAAVGAGTIRMIGERRLPGTLAGQSLEAAWRTKQEIDAFIDARSRAGTAPSRTPQAVFRALSALLALFRNDPLRALSEARWAALLSDWEPVSTLASAVASLAQTITSDDGPDHRASTLLKGIDDDLGVRGLKGMAQVLAILADGNDALRRLDRDEVDRALSAVSPEAAAIAGVWSLRASLAASRAALWGDAGEGLKRLSADIAQQSVLGREQEEPWGSTNLTRARVLLLIKAGAFGAATRAAETLTGSLKLLPAARIHLWCGDFKRAIRLADVGPYAAGLEQVDEYRLLILKTAAALLGGTCASKLRAAGVAELSLALGNEAFLPIAKLPKPARDALVDLYRSDGKPDDPRLQRLVDRLAQLNDAGEGAARPVRLTEREAILLPMLATDDPVPEIARKLQVSVNTVRKQVVTLREKFQADTRSELIRRAIAYGALP